MKPNNHNYIEEVKLDFPHKDDNNWLEIEVGGQKIPQYPSPLEVKMLLTAYHEHLIGELLLLRVNVCICHQGGGYVICCDECKNAELCCLDRRTYNSAIDDIITKLQGKK